MNKKKIARFFPVLIVILVVVFTIFVLVSLGRSIFNGLNSGNNQSNQTQARTFRDDLLMTEPGYSVRMIVRGAIVADENFRSYQITVSPTARQMVVYKGYLGEVIEKVDLPNNSSAYTEFVYALDKQSLANFRPLETSQDDVRGVCAIGTVTEFDIEKDGKSTYHVWTSSCSGSKGSLTAGEQNLRNLFLKQIPDNNKLLSKFRG